MRVEEDSGERRRFSSAILPAWCRKSPKITEVLPLLYLLVRNGATFKNGKLVERPSRTGRARTEAA